MTTTIGINGRFCNHFIRNICVSMIARKHNLFTTYSYADEIKSLGIELYSGNKKYNQALYLNDINFIDYLYNEPPVNKNFLILFHTYFQTKAISNILHNYLHLPEIKTPIINANRFKARYNSNNDVFIHVRLGDVVNYNPGLAYYEKVIQMISYKNPGDIYISSDSIDHITCKLLISKNRAKPIEYDYLDTIRFGSTCKYVILSHGSFSATIGNLAYYSDIYYPKYDPRKIWYGDMFTGNGWNEVSF
ncbi:MAG: hypothetical protein EB127_17720 [Alphaproteobacteria bacterium]|nr:hypothetical protein [Alphaproteobacteria bacterium]